MTGTESKIWIGKGDQRYGPYLESNVRLWMKEGKLGPDLLGWRSGMQAWTKLSVMLADMQMDGVSSTTHPESEGDDLETEIVTKSSGHDFKAASHSNPDAVDMVGAGASLHKTELTESPKNWEDDPHEWNVRDLKPHHLWIALSAILIICWLVLNHSHPVIIASASVIVAIWIYLDACKHSIGKNPKEYSPRSLSAGSWAACGLIFWPVGLPLYLYRRTVLIDLAKKFPVLPKNKKQSLVILGIASAALLGMNLWSAKAQNSSDIASSASPIDVQVSSVPISMGVEEYGGTAVGPGLTVWHDEVTITGKTSHTIIQNITINRGNCKVSLTGSGGLPLSLAFGEVKELSVYSCNVGEVSVLTDSGNWTANFQNGPAKPSNVYDAAAQRVNANICSVDPSRC